MHLAAVLQTSTVWCSTVRSSSELVLTVLTCAAEALGRLVVLRADGVVLLCFAPRKGGALYFVCY